MGKTAVTQKQAIEQLSAVGFRCFRSLTLDFPSGLTLLTGENAQGKTSLLEAVYYLSSGRLLRTKRDQEAICIGAELAEVHAVLGENKSEIAIHVPLGGKKKAFLNGMSLPKVSDLLGRLPAVAISALDLELAQGEPSSRRLFLDLELSRLYPGYLVKLAQYKRALEQRNSLLKLALVQSIQAEQFEIWEQALAEAGDQIRRHRWQYFESFCPICASSYRLLTPVENLIIEPKYGDDAVDMEGLADQFASARQDDIRRGSTSLGPHRDDFVMQIEGMDVRQFGSQGQQRSTAIALKLGAFYVSRETIGSSPLLLLDDMLSDLDHHRRSALAELLIHESDQAILTCTEADSISPEILGKATQFTVSQGEVFPK